MKTFLQFTDTDGEPLLLDVDAILVVEPKMHRDSDGRAASGTLITYRGIERMLGDSYSSVLAQLTTVAKVVQQ